MSLTVQIKKKQKKKQMTPNVPSAFQLSPISHGWSQNYRTIDQDGRLNCNDKQLEAISQDKVKQADEKRQRGFIYEAETFRHICGRRPHF